MKQFFDLDMIGFIGLTVLAFMEWIDPTMKIVLAGVALLGGTVKLLQYLSSSKVMREKRIEEREKRERREKEKEKRNEERQKHELEMAILHKELERKEMENHKLGAGLPNRQSNHINLPKEIISPFTKRNNITFQKQPVFHFGKEGKNEKQTCIG